MSCWIPPQLSEKKIYIFSQSIRMSGKRINFEDKKNQQKQFLQKQKAI